VSDWWLAADAHSSWLVAARGGGGGDRRQATGGDGLMMMSEAVHSWLVERAAIIVRSDSCGGGGYNRLQYLPGDVPMVNSNTIM
jgi:hypothetical protein